MISILNRIFSILCIGVIIILFDLSLLSQSEKIRPDSVHERVNNFRNHVETLKYIGRLTDQQPSYINLAENYCDSILALDPVNEYALITRKKISLIKKSCNENLNYKIQLFPFFSGDFVNYYGFADDALEYSFETTLNSLVNTGFDSKHIKNIPFASLIFCDNCSDKISEFLIQNLFTTTSNRVLQSQNSGFSENLRKITYNKLDSFSINDGAEMIGVYHATILDSIYDRIWLTKISFGEYKPNTNTGFNNTFSAIGFNHDKRIGILKWLILLLVCFLVLATFSLFILRSNFKEIIGNKGYRFHYFIREIPEKIRKTLLYALLPLVITPGILYLISLISPTGGSHYLEFQSVIFFICLIGGIGLVPFFLNLLILNRLNLPELHTSLGYSTLFLVSFNAALIPVFLFYIVDFELFPWLQIIMVFILSLFVSPVFGKSLNVILSGSKFRNYRYFPRIGLLMGISSIFIILYLILLNLSPNHLMHAFIPVAFIFGVFEWTKKILDLKNTKLATLSNEIKLLDQLPFVNEVYPINKVLDVIHADLVENKLQVYLVQTVSGMGKTRTISEAGSWLKKEGWEIYYGDCDEIQHPDSVSFEPFVQAFGSLLGVIKFQSRSKIIEKAGQVIQSIGGNFLLGTEAFNIDGLTKEIPLLETCVNIVEKLEKYQNKILFILEDIQWIDVESLAFLKHFLASVSRNDTVRQNMRVIITLNESITETDRIIQSSENLADKLKDWSKNLDFPFKVKVLINNDDFNLKDFVLNLSNDSNDFMIQARSLQKINHAFNDLLQQKDKTFTLTPSYMIKVLEGWIDDKTLEFAEEGYYLKDLNQELFFPNTNEYDRYYHEILITFDPKWTRLLETATYIGNKFNASLLAKVWGYDLLSVLDFLEQAEQKGIIKDVVNEDNYFEFTGKRVIKSIQNFFPGPTHEGIKQIVREYNKRYFDLHADIIKSPDNFEIEEILTVLRRVITYIPQYVNIRFIHKAIIEIVVRIAWSENLDKLKAFAHFLENTPFQSYSPLIQLTIDSVNQEKSTSEKAHAYRKLKDQRFSVNSIEEELQLIAMCFYDGPQDQEDFQRLSSFRLKIFNDYAGEIIYILYSRIFERTKMTGEEKLELMNDVDEKLKTHNRYGSYRFYIKNSVNEAKIGCQRLDQWPELEADTSQILLDSLKSEEYRIRYACLLTRCQFLEKIRDNKKYQETFFKILPFIAPVGEINIYMIKAYIWYFEKANYALNFEAFKEEIDLFFSSASRYFVQRFNSKEISTLENSFYTIKRRYLLINNADGAYEKLTDHHINKVIDNYGKEDIAYANILMVHKNYLFKKKRFSEALENILEALKIYKNCSGEHESVLSMEISASHCYIKINDRKNSIKYAESAFELAKNRDEFLKGKIGVNAFRRIGDCYRDNGYLVKALYCYHQYNKKIINHPNRTNLQAYINLKIADLHFDLNRGDARLELEKAIQEMENVLKGDQRLNKGDEIAFKNELEIAYDKLNIHN